MGQVISGNINFQAQFSESVATLITAYSIPLNMVASFSYANGTASNQIDTAYAESKSLASTTQTLDLTSLTDPAGISVNFARVREFIVFNTSVTAGFDLKVEAGGSNGMSTMLPVSTGPDFARYGGRMWLSDPLSTGASNGFYVDGTHKTITFDSGSNTVTFLLLILGTSVA